MSGEPRPSFLFIITDQHRADHLSCYGNRTLRTPHIDALAARGVAFDRFYVTAPVCMPNRAAIMTGRMPSVNGVRSNGIPLSLDAVTFVDLLRAAGYRTALVGKSHLQNMEDRPALVAPEPDEGQALAGFDEASYPDIRGAEHEQEARSRWDDPAHRLRLPFYGFEHVELCNHHGDETFGDWSRWAAEREPGFRGLCGPENAAPDPRFTAPQARRTRLPEELYSTSYIAERTVAFLEQHTRRSGEQPFFLQCSFPDPHHPFTPPGRYWGLYDPADVVAPPTCGAPGENAPPHVRWAHAERVAGKAVLTGPRMFAVDAREAREIIALTYAMIAMIDDAVGKIVAALERVGLAERTIVVVTSDHGDFMGDHGLMLKGPLHYQGLVRVPFIWAEPGAREPARTSALGSGLDIARTVLGRAGLKPYNGIQGRNLFTQPAPDAVLIEEDNQRAYLGFAEPPRARTLVTERHRLTLYRGVAWGELYDLQDDPDELRNLWGEPAAAPLRAALTERLAHRLLETCDRSPLPTRLA